MMIWFILFQGQIMINNCWRIYLIMRQLRLCSLTPRLPTIYADAMPDFIFNKARLKEMHDLERLIWNQFVDLVFSCAELFIGFYPSLWQFTTFLYEKCKDDTWISMCFALMLTIYIEFRYFPVLVYNLVVDDHYVKQTEDPAPFIFWICAFCFTIVLLQVFFAPATFIITSVANVTGYFFPFWTWLLVITIGFFLRFVFIVVCIPFFGKEEILPDSFLRIEIKKVTDMANFPISRVHVLHTWHILRGMIAVLGCFCCQRLIILDTLVMNTGSNFVIATSIVFESGLPNNEVAALVAHALGHWKFWHDEIIFLVVAQLLLIWFALFGLCFYKNILFDTVGFDNNVHPLIVAYVIAFKYALPLYMNIANFLLFSALRWTEFRADRFVHRMGYGKQLSAAYIKCCANFEQFPLADPLYKMWYHRKPTMLERVTYLKKLETTDSI